MVVHSVGSAAINESTFGQINRCVVEAYQKEVADTYNAELLLQEYWIGFGGAFKVDSTWRQLNGKKFLLTLTGKIPNVTEISPEAYAIVVCHEMGHIMGGEPRQKSKLAVWSSVEGQADYYATNVCMWQYLKAAKENKSIQQHETLGKKCKQKFGEDEASYLKCLRIVSGIISLQNYFNNDGNEKNRVSIDAVDTTEVSETLEKYPALNQCRMDTFIAGLFNEPRPACWFKK